MTIVKCRQTSEDTSITSSGVTINQEYELLDDANGDNPIQIYRDGWRGGFIPKVDGHYAGEYDCVVKTVRPQRAAKGGLQNGHFLWKVSVEYGPNESGEAPNFIDISTKISGHFEFIDIDNLTDLDGKWNASSSGEFFEERLPIKASVAVWTFQRSESVNPSARSYNFANHINSLPLWGFRPTTLLCRDIRTERVFSTSTGLFYWNVTYDIAYNPKTWLLQKADCGYYSINQSGRFRLLNEDGSPVEKPKLLDGAGGLLPSGMAIKFPFRVHEYADLNLLNLPDPT